jgi:hypothetical protein
MTPVSKQHCCANCGKTWECPHKDDCMASIVILCSRCMNMISNDNHSTPLSQD